MPIIPNPKLYLQENKILNFALGDPLKTGVVEIRTVLGIAIIGYLLIYACVKFYKKKKGQQLGTWGELVYEFVSEPLKGSMKISALLIQDVIKAHYHSGVEAVLRKYLLNILGAIVFAALMYVVAVTILILSKGISLEIFCNFFQVSWNQRVLMLFDFFSDNVYTNTTLLSLYVLLTIEYSKTKFLEKKYWHLKRSGILLSVPLGEWDETPKLNIPETELVENAKQVIKSIINNKEVDQVRLKVASGYDVFGTDGFLNDLIKKPNVCWRILIMNPDGEGVKKREASYKTERAADPIQGNVSYSDSIRAIINKISKIKVECNPNIQIRIYDHIPQWKMYICSGLAIVGAFGPGQRSDRVPLYIFENSSTSLFHGYEEMFEDIWHNSSQPIPET